jgi:hypothetical protein
MARRDIGLDMTLCTPIRAPGPSTVPASEEGALERIRAARGDRSTADTLRWLIQCADPLPVELAPAPASPATDEEAVRIILDAWAALCVVERAASGLTSIAALRSQHPLLHRVWDGLRVLGCEVGTATAHQLGAGLARLRGRVAGGRRLVGRKIRTNQRQWVVEPCAGTEAEPMQPRRVAEVPASKTPRVAKGKPRSAGSWPGWKG